jgi:hypothetical protein
MNLFAGMQNLDVEGWARGLIGAGISGGSAAITSSIGVTILDPQHWTFQNGKLWGLIGITFTMNAVVSMAKFLQSQPLPSMKTVETTKEVVREPQPGVVVTSTVKETHVEPVTPAK